MDFYYYKLKPREKQLYLGYCIHAITEQYDTGEITDANLVVEKLRQVLDGVYIPPEALAVDGILGQIQTLIQNTDPELEIVIAWRVKKLKFADVRQQLLLGWSGLEDWRSFLYKTEDRPLNRDFCKTSQRRLIAIMDYGVTRRSLLEVIRKTKLPTDVYFQIKDIILAQDPTNEV